MRVLLMTLALVFGLSLNAQVKAAENLMDGITLHQICGPFKVPKNKYKHGLCAGFLVAIADIYQSNPNDDFCFVVPEVDPRKKMIEAYNKWGVENPQERKVDGWVAVLLALNSEFPCPK